MADQWLLHTELMRSCIWLIHGYCTRSCMWLQYTTAAKELLRRGLLRRGLLHMAPAVLLLRRKCCEGNAEERTAAKKLLRTDCCEGDFCMRLCFTPAENGLLHTELMRSWSGAAHD